MRGTFLRKPNISEMIMKDQSKQNASQKTNTALLSDSLAVSNQKTQYFSFRVGNTVDETDNTIAWSYNVPVLSPNQKSLYFVTEAFTTVILDYVGDNFPQTISLTIKNFSGFKGLSGNQTNKVIVLNLSAINSIITPQGIVSRDLVYKNQTAATWQLGQLRQLQFQIFLDDQTSPVNLPLSNSLNVSFKILHLTV